MQDLIPLHQQTIGQEIRQTVNAKDLHTFLGVKTRLDNWVKRRIETYGFVQGIDFCESTLGHGPTKTTEYHVSLDMAKELSMVERTKKGKEARQYFLECEKTAQAQGSTGQLSPKSPEQMFELQAQMYSLQVAVNKEYAQRLSVLENTVEALKAERPPLGKFSCIEWLTKHRKPFLPATLLSNFRATCRRIERPESFRPASSQYDQLYYSPDTLESAYEETMRQMVLFPGQERKRGHR